MKKIVGTVHRSNENASKHTLINRDFEAETQYEYGLSKRDPPFRLSSEFWFWHELNRIRTPNRNRIPKKRRKICAVLSVFFVHVASATLQRSRHSRTVAQRHPWIWVHPISVQTRVRDHIYCYRIIRNVISLISLMGAVPHGSVWKSVACPRRTTNGKSWFLVCCPKSIYFEFVLFYLLKSV